MHCPSTYQRRYVLVSFEIYELEQSDVEVGECTGGGCCYGIEVEEPDE